MIVLARAVTYAALFIGLVLVLLPAQLLSWSGMTPPAGRGISQMAGVAMAGAGGVLALWCVATFAIVGKGTPAPFDPPRRLVVQGPYRLVRNPMYVGAALSLAGAALHYESGLLLGYMGLFSLTMHLLVIWYEEPALQRAFGRDYAAYCQRVGRWWPRVSA
jgi:protein-S-isoprenylcysteine O-methyltransferase Ste14